MIRKLPRLATVLIAVVLSLAVVIAPKGDRAEAWAGPIAPIILGGEIAATPAEGAAVGGLCATGVGCLALGVAALGITAYATKDSWLPVVKGWFNDPSSTNNGGATANTCSEALLSAPVNGDNTVTVTTSWAGCSTSATDLRIWVSNLKCIGASGVTSTSGETQSGSSQRVSTGSGSLSWSTAALCPAGTYVGSVGVRVGRSFPTGVYSNSLTVAGGYPDSLQVNTTTVTCSDAGGGTHTLTGTDSGYPGRIAVPSCAAHGWLPEHVTVTDPLHGTLATWDAPSPSYETSFPDCFIDHHLECTIRVFVDDVNCSDDSAPGHCVDWQNFHALHPARVKCKFGSYTVNIGNCDPLAHAYPATTPQEVTDPNTWPSPNDGTDPSPSASPGTGGLPSTGDNPAPSGQPDPSEDPDSSSCLGAAWSWNPVDWVYVPVKCALRWAFVPRTGELQANVTAMRTSLSGTTPAVWLAALGDLAPSSSESGCAGPLVTVPIHGVTESFHPLDACSGAGASAAAVCHALLTAGVVIFGALGCVKALTNGFSYNPGGGS